MAGEMQQTRREHAVEIKNRSRSAIPAAATSREEGETQLFLQFVERCCNLELERPWWSFLLFKRIESKQVSDPIRRALQMAIG
jgi:hypothetical protein